MQQRTILSASLSLSLLVCLFLSEPSLVTIVTGEQKEKQKVYMYRYFFVLTVFRKHMRCQSTGKGIDSVSSHSFVVLFNLLSLFLLHSLKRKHVNPPCQTLTHTFLHLWTLFATYDLLD